LNNKKNLKIFVTVSKKRVIFAEKLIIMPTKMIVEKTIEKINNNLEELEEKQKTINDMLDSFKYSIDIVYNKLSKN
jgi:hypothetical protein